MGIKVIHKALNNALLLVTDKLVLIFQELLI